jgi:hypothetical protein
MNLSQSAIFWLYACSALLGIALGLFYDGLRITRIFLGESYSINGEFYERELPLIGRVRKKGKRRVLRSVIFLEDFFFCILAGIFQILLFYQLYNGNVRLPAILFLIGGFFAYRLTLGKPILWCSERIAFFVECAVRYTFFIVFLPVKLLLSLFGKVCRRVILEAERKRRIHYTKRLLAISLSEELRGGRIKERRKIRVRTKKKAIQPESSGAGVSDDSDRRVSRRVHRRRDAV